MFCTYIIQSEKNGKWYYGHSENIERRLVDHNTGKNKSTKNKGPWKIIFRRDFDSKILAARFELELKRLKNKEYIKKTFKEFFLGMQHSPVVRPDESGRSPLRDLNCN